jgi:hypothetical protein
MIRFFFKAISTFLFPGKQNKCVKSVLDGDTYRSCNEGSNGCKSSESGHAEQCYCDKDLCNDAAFGSGGSAGSSASSMSSIGGIFIRILTTGAVLSAAFGGFSKQQRSSLNTFIFMKRA